MIKQGQHVFLTATPGASQRTKNRIRERGEQGFKVKKEAQPCRFDNNRGVNWVQLDAVGNDWSGWLPVDEIEVVA